MTKKQMDIGRLTVRIVDFCPSNDGKTFLYKIDIGYGAIIWNVYRRFSDFHALDEKLRVEGFAGLPHIPSKSLTRPNDDETARGRMARLNKYLLGLICRPDTRMSARVMDFLDFEEQTNITVPECRMNLISQGMVSRYSMSQFDYNSSSGLIVASLGEAGALARLGKAWNIIDPEEAGKMCLGTLLPDGSIDTIASAGSAVPITACMVVPRDHVDGAPRILFFDCNGTLYVFKFVDTEIPPGKQVLNPSVPWNIGYYWPGNDGVLLEMEQKHQIHMKARVLRLIHGRNHDELMTVATDNCIRVLRISSQGCVLVCGGHIHKCLSHKEMLTSITNDGDTIYLTTSHGQVLVYDITTHPPTIVITHDLRNLVADLEGRDTFEGMRLHISFITSLGESRMAVGIGGMVLVLQDFNRVIWKMEINDGNGCARCCCVADLENMDRAIFIGFGKSVAVWSLESGDLLQCMEGLNWGGITDLVVHRDLLMVGTEYRGIQILSLQGVSHWTQWKVHGLNPPNAAVIKKDAQSQKPPSPVRTNVTRPVFCDPLEDLVEAFNQGAVF